MTDRDPIVLQQGGQIVLEGLAIAPRATLEDAGGPYVQLLIGDGPSGGDAVESITLRPGERVELARGILEIEEIRPSTREARGGLLLGYEPLD